ncbi:MAG TPA: helix-turn-helix domain-containing protein [Anaerolineales bacterium]|jgi:AcrR family transcriptional regulator
MADEVLSSKSDRTSTAILDAAYLLFTSQGYAATSMRQIAERAGLAVGSIYNHFPSKEAIFEDIIRMRHPFYLVMPLLMEASGETMDEFIRSAARGLVTELGHHPEFLNLMLTELVEFKGQHVASLFEKIFPDIMVVGQRLTAYQQELRPIPAPVLMRAFIGMFFSYFITDMLLKKFMPLEMQENSFETFVDIFLNGIRQPAGLPLVKQAGWSEDRR